MSNIKYGDLKEFIDYLKQTVANHSIFVWGGQGQRAPKVCEAWIRQRETDTGGTKYKGRFRTYADIAVDQWKKKVAEGWGSVLQAFDCSGLVVYWLLLKKLIDKDINANGLHGLCKGTTDRRAGYWVFRLQNGRAVHVGVLVDENTVIHAKGRADGVVAEPYNPESGYWHAIGIPRMFNFEEPLPDPQPEPDPEPKPSHAGEKYVRVKGKMRIVEGVKKPDKRVRVRVSNNPDSKSIGTAYSEEMYRMIGQADTEPRWYKIEFKGKQGYISNKEKYTEVIVK